ncbi:MAG: N-acetylglucosamine kinase [Clostridia bacterium]
MILNNYLIAVDGGGTKTVFCAYNLKNATKTYFYSGSTNYKSIGEVTARENLTTGFKSVYDQLNIKKGEVKGIVLGLSGFDSGMDYQIYDNMLNTLDIDKNLVYMCNDSELAFYAGGKAPGIAIISGTGSIAIGIDAAGEKRRAGGWGSPLSDLGSGYWIGSQVIKQLLLYCDDCGPYEDIFETIKNAYHSESYSTLPMTITRLNSHEIAAVAKTVVEYAEKGDAYSIGIIDEAIEYLCILVNSVYRKLNFIKEDSINIVVAGSLFKSHFFIDKLEVGLKTGFDMKNIKLLPVVIEPVDGGIMVALEKFMTES